MIVNNNFSKAQNAQGIIDIAIDILKANPKLAKAESDKAVARLRDKKVPFNVRFNEANVIWKADIKAQLDTMADDFEQQVKVLTDKYQAEHCTPFAVLTAANEACDYGLIDRSDAHKIIEYAFENNTDFNSAMTKTGIGVKDSYLTINRAVRAVFEAEPELAKAFIDESKFEEISSKVYEKMSVKPDSKAIFDENLKKYLLYV